MAADFEVTPDDSSVQFPAENQDPDAFESFVRTIGGHLSGQAEPR